MSVDEARAEAEVAVPSGGEEDGEGESVELDGEALANGAEPQDGARASSPVPPRLKRIGRSGAR